MESKLLSSLVNIFGSGNLWYMMYISFLGNIYNIRGILNRKSIETRSKSSTAEYTRKDIMSLLFV
jgi:hypothetical protein